MTKREHILNELRQITRSADQFTSGNPYQVPAGYFEQLPEELLKRVKAEESVFNSASDELQALSPLLAKLDKKMLFSVPEGYFNKLDMPVIPRMNAPETNNLPEAKVVHLSFARKAIRFAVAASIIGLIGIGAWFLTQPGSKEVKYASAQDVVQKVQKLSDNEINAYFETNNPTAEVYQNTAVSDEIKTEDVKLMLADVSDEELQLYVDQDNAQTPVLN